MILEFDEIPQIGIKNPYIETLDDKIISNPLLTVAENIHVNNRLRIKDLSGNWIQRNDFLPVGSVIKFFIKNRNIFIIQKEYDKNIYIPFEVYQNNNRSVFSISVDGLLFVCETELKSKFDLNYFLSMNLNREITNKIENYVVKQLNTICHSDLDRKQFIPQLRRIKAMRNHFLHNSADTNEALAAKELYKQTINKVSNNW